jgi:hypothetical protein
MSTGASKTEDVQRNCQSGTVQHEQNCDILHGRTLEIGSTPTGWEKTKHWDRSNAAVEIFTLASLASPGDLFEWDGTLQWNGPRI